MIVSAEEMRKCSSKALMPRYTKRYTRYLKKTMRKIQRQSKQGLYQYADTYDYLDQIEFKAMKDVVTAFTAVGYKGKYTVSQEKLGGEIFYKISFVIAWDAT